MSKMDDTNPSPSPPPASPHTAVCRRFAPDEDAADQVPCTGKSCQSCTAGAIADCVAVCCCPCAVVNFFILTFLKLPYSIARKCLLDRRRKRRRRRMLECSAEAPEKSEGRMGISVDEVINVSFRGEEVWVEPLGFGRVSFTGIDFHNRGS